MNEASLMVHHMPGYRLFVIAITIILFPFFRRRNDFSGLGEELKVVLATASVILLALFSPLPHRKVHKTPQLALSFYIQQPQVGGSSTHPAPPKAGALIFHRMLTEGPENTSRVVGKAQGFIIPVESFAYSAFNIIYLTFHTHEYSGSISIQAKNFGHKETEELAVVGGTGSFSFARGLAVFAETNRQTPNLDATYLIKLHLKFPNRSQTIPG
ncbi:UNVERIFIED_CONTAM: Dirigent protein 11 [Sesamum radiatum]|uniref:Dirigent protein n=1 Tax=Sesamum radiatum TaxID=300843 RepID=A0AAW2QEX6_SESRA